VQRGYRLRLFSFYVYVFIFNTSLTKIFYSNLSVKLSGELSSCQQNLQRRLLYGDQLVFMYVIHAWTDELFHFAW